MTDYVVGILFKKAAVPRSIYLIRKERPRWQKGLLNGIGGKIETGESPLEAMIRECQEEAGIYVADWALFLTITGRDYRIFFFVAETNKDAKTTTDEAIELIPIKPISTRIDMVANLSWIIPLSEDSTVVRPVMISDR